MSILSYETVVVNVTPTKAQLYRLGWNIFCDGLPRTVCETTDHKRGWDAANRAMAETLTDGYAESMGW